MDKLVPMPRDGLRGFERLAVPLLERINSSHRARRAIYASLGRINAWAIEKLVGPLWQVYGLEHLQSLDAPNGLILVSNHRSFVDFYYLATVLSRHTDLMREVTFPVRSPFFYDTPWGMFLNLAMSGGTMWPPVFRDNRKRHFNSVGLQQIAWSIGPGAVMGIHPEGRRNPDGSTWTYLPVKPGFGQLLPHLHPDVAIVPAFVAGAAASVAHEIRRARLPKGRQGEAVRLRFDRGLRAGDLVALGLDPLAITEHVFARVRALGEQDRAEFAGNSG